MSTTRNALPMASAMLGTALLVGGLCTMRFVETALHMVGDSAPKLWVLDTEGFGIPHRRIYMLAVLAAALGAALIVPQLLRRRA